MHPDRIHTKFTRDLLTPLRSVIEDALNGDLIALNPFDRTALTKFLEQASGSSAYEVDPFTPEARGNRIFKRHKTPQEWA